MHLYWFVVGLTGLLTSHTPFLSPPYPSAHAFVRSFVRFPGPGELSQGVTPSRALLHGSRALTTTRSRMRQQQSSSLLSPMLLWQHLFLVLTSFLLSLSLSLHHHLRRAKSRERWKNAFSRLLHTAFFLKTALYPPLGSSPRRYFLSSSCSREK